MAFPDEISVPFLLEDTKDNSVEMAVKLGGNISEHIRTHYAIYASQGLEVDVSQFSTLDLIYYHVYGDYRLVLLDPPSSSSPDFLKSLSVDIPSTAYRYISAPPQNIPTLKGKANSLFLEEYLVEELKNKDKLKGALLPDSSGRPALATTQTATEWFQREMVFKSSANKFHLPSLGTMAIATMGIKASADKIRKAARDLLSTMYEFIEDNPEEERIPKFLRDDFDATAAPLNATRVRNKRKLIHAFHEALVANPEYKEMRANFPDSIPDEDALKEAVLDAFKFESGFDASQAYINKLLEVTKLKFDLGMPVRFKPGKVSTYATKSGLLDEDIKAGDWLIVATAPSKGKGKGPKGIFSVRDAVGNLVTGVSHGDLDLRIVDLDDEAVFESAASKKQYLVSPTSLVFFRLVLDILFTFEAILYASNIPYQTAKLDNSINITTRLATIENRYPNMRHIYEEPYQPNIIKDKPGAIATFAELRTSHTLAHLANLDTANPNLGIENFYKEDLRLSEVTWLSQALTDEGKAVLERKEKPNILAQLQYTAKGIGEGVSAEAPVNAKTVFYQMDSLILKDVIMAYDQLFIDFTITNSFMPKDKKKKKGSSAPPPKPEEGEDNIRIKELATSIWGSIAGRSSDILNRPGVKPHIIFNRLFKQMEALSSRIYFVADNYPPKWTGTNTVTKLSRDPLILGEEIDMKYYSERMTEYLKHLKNNYMSVPAVAQLVLTVLGDIVIETEGNIDSLRESFIARIKSQAKRPMLKGTSNRFDAYRAVMCVMRSEIDIPLQFREAFVAQKLDEAQRERIKDSFTKDSQPFVLPESHPEFVPPKEEELVEDESELFGSDNPKDMPLPPFYPKPGSVLNRNHPDVAKLLDELIGPATEDFFPAGSFFSSVTSKKTPDEVKNLKIEMLNPKSKFTVQPIDWKAGLTIWDGRDKVTDPPNPSVVAQYRDNLGVVFQWERANDAKEMIDPVEFDIVPNRDLTNYDSILYRNHTNGPTDRSLYVYFPPGGVFKNPFNVYSETDGSYVEDDIDYSSGGAFMVYRQDILGEPKPKADPLEIDFEPITDKLEKLDTGLLLHGTTISDATDRNTAELSRIATAVDGAGSKFADAGTSFERAGEAFERASIQFNEAARYYEQSAQAFREIPDALRIALVSASEEIIDTLEMKYGEGWEEKATEEELEEATEAIEVVEKSDPSNTGYIADLKERADMLPTIVPIGRYNYRAWTSSSTGTPLKEILRENLGINQGDLEDLFLAEKPQKYTHKQLRRDIGKTFNAAILQDGSDKLIQSSPELQDALSPKQYENHLWRVYAISILEAVKDKTPEEIRRMFGVTDFQKEEVEVEEAEDDGPGFFERGRELIDRGKTAAQEKFEDLKEDLEESGIVDKIAKKVKA